MKENINQNIDNLANEANETMIENKYLENKLNLYKKYINLTKDTMQKLFNKNNSAIKLFNSYIDEIQKDYDKLYEKYEKEYYPEYESLIDECFNDISMGKPYLKQYRAQAFVLEYLSEERDCIINGLKTSIKNSKHYHLFREPKRDNLVDLKEGNKEMEKANTELQQNVLYECKEYNKYSNRIKKYTYQIKEIQRNIEILKKYIAEDSAKQSSNIIGNSNSNPNDHDNDNISPDTNNKPTQEKTEEKKEKENESTTKNKYHYGKINLKQSVNIGLFNPFFGVKKGNEESEHINSNENRSQGSAGEKIAKKKSGGINIKKSLNKINKVKPVEKKRNKIIKEFKKIEDLFNSSSEEGEKEQLIDDELHSDDETVFEKKIKFGKNLTKDYLSDIKKNIPEITLNQIEYNKMKIMKEADLYSLQRRRIRAQNIDTNIKELKKKIERMNEKLELIKKKEVIMKEYIDKKRNQYESLKPMKTRTSVKDLKVEYIKKSIFGKDFNLIKEEDNEEDLGDGSFGSDYDNEEEELPEKEVENIVNMKGDMKRSVFVGPFNFKSKKKKKGENNNMSIKQSVNVEMFQNHLRDKFKRSKSK